MNIQYTTYINYFRNTTNYNYDNVNYKLYFINSETGSQSQNIDNLWSQFKKVKRKK